MREGRLDNAALGQALADVIGHLGNARLVDRLASLLHVLVPANDIMVVVYRRGQPPELLLDPFYRAFADGVAPGCYRLKQLAPAAFRSSEYFRLHYARTGISDEIGYLLEPTADMCVHLSVGVREQQSRISAAQHRRLLDFEPLFAAIVRRHWAPHDAIVSRAINTQLDSALKFFGHDFLTDREVEVIQLLLRGHSTKSIADRLRISPETVKLHRKHSYAKLDVSSQAELFHLFIDALGSYQGGDPLTGYLSH